MADDVRDEPADERADREASAVPEPDPVGLEERRPVDVEDGEPVPAVWAGPGADDSDEPAAGQVGEAIDAEGGGDIPAARAGTVTPNAPTRDAATGAGTARTRRRLPRTASVEPIDLETPDSGTGTPG